MRPSFKSITTLLAVCGSLILSTNAQAQFWGHGHGEKEWKKKREQKIQQVYDQLGLSQEQQKLLAENKARHEAAKESVASGLKGAMEAMGEELKKEDLDMPKIESMRAQFKNLRDQMADERFNAILEVRKILTQEQFAKFIELIRQEKWQEKEKQ